MENKQQPKVSVIIPVYNTAPYLKEAVGSILGQTLKELQVIIVNDGSTDESQTILEKLAKEDRRIEIYTQTNQGLSAARNLGIKYIRGKYVYFMDSDDMLMSEALETCYKYCELNNLELVFFDAENITDSFTGKMQNYDRRNNGMENRIWNGTELLAYQVKNWLYKSPVWLHFISAKFMQSFFHGFEVGKIHEDHLFTVGAYLHATRVYYLPHVFFRRRIREGSIMNKTFSMKNVDGYISAIKSIRNIKGDFLTKDIFLKQIANAVVWEAHSLCLKDRIKLVQLFVKFHIMRYVKIKTWCVFTLKR